MRHLNHLLSQVLIMSILLFLSSCSSDGRRSEKKIEIVESLDFWEEIIPKINVVPGLTNDLSEKDWRNLLSTPSTVSSRMGNRELNFHILENGTFFLERTSRPITFFYSDDFGRTWNGVDIKDEDDPSFVPYFKNGGIYVDGKKVRVSTGVGGTLFKSKGKPGVFESSDGKIWKKISEDESKKEVVATYKGLTYAKDYNYSEKRNSSTLQNIFDFKNKQIYQKRGPELEQGNYQYLVITCDGTEIEFGGPFLAITPSSRRTKLIRNDAFMLMQSNLIYDNILGQNSGNIDTFLLNYNTNEGISGKEKLIDNGDYAYYIRINNQWIKTNVHLRNSSIKYSLKDKRLYAISDEGRFYRSKSEIKTSCE